MSGGGGAAAPSPADAIQNERVKLAAAWLNTISAGLIVVGIVAPGAALFLGGFPGQPGAARVLACFLALLGASGALHWAAQTILGRLRP